MAKLVVVLNVVAWSGFWAFGYLVLSGGDGGSMDVAALLAAVGAGLGLRTWVWLVGQSRATGHAPAPTRVCPDEDLRRNEGAI
ncbi:hypothetical protein [Salipiger sp.]|uniref:hypothetical protein n=1 Tax=Salipiger sp. TaxID=2078585 RepID=UPI003A98711B